MDPDHPETHKNFPKMSYLILTLRSLRETSGTLAAVGILWAVIQGAAMFPVEWKTMRQDVSLIKTVEIPALKNADLELRGQTIELRNQSAMISKDINFLRENLIEMKVLLEKVLDRQYETTHKADEK